MTARRMLPGILSAPQRRGDHLLAASEEAGEDSIESHFPSPPYRSISHSSASPSYRSVPVASSSNPHLEYYPPIPSYSQDEYNDQLNVMQEKREKHASYSEAPSMVDVTLEEHDPRSRPAKVQFSEELNKVSPPSFQRKDSDFVSSAPSSIAGTDEEDSEDYDWSGEEDLVDEAAKFGSQIGGGDKQNKWGFKRMLEFLFSSLIGSTFLAGLLVTPALFVHFYWYKPHPTEHRRYVNQNVQAWLVWAASNLVISWYLAMIVDIIPIIVRYFISATWGHVSEAVKTKIELYDSVKDTFKPALYASSTYASWVIIFGNIYKLYDASNASQSRASYTQRLSEAVEFFFFFVIVRCVQRMLSHFIAFSFHRTAYKERIEGVQEALAVIEKLRDFRPKLRAPRMKSRGRSNLFSGFSPGTLLQEEDPDSSSGALYTASPLVSRSNTWYEDESNDGDIEEKAIPSRQRVKVTDSFSWLGEDKNLRLLRRAEDGNMSYPESSGRRNADGYGKRENADNEMEMVPPSLPPSRPTTPTFNPNPHRYPPSVKNSRSSFDASVELDTTLVNAAKVLKNAVLHDARNIRGKDDDLGGLSWNVNSAYEAKHLARSIYTRLKDRHRTYLIAADFYQAFPDHASAEAAFRVFDKDSHGDISRAELKTAVLKVYKERRFLSRSMRDVGEALKTLDRMLMFLAAVILVFIGLSVFGVQIGSSLTSLYSLLIAASFIFKNTASSMFDAVMFCFVTHPYDTGDRCFVDNENLVVKKVGLFATVFARSDGTQTYYFNSQLFTKFITNVRRSGKTFENLTMQVAWRTPLQKLDALEKSLNTWLSTEENRWFEPSTSITLQNISYQKYLEITIGIGHNGNWQDWGLRNSRKTAFHAAVHYYCRQLGIVGCEAPMPIVYADPVTGRYTPHHTAGFEVDDDPRTPTLDTSPSPGGQEEAEDGELKAKDVKSLLGFVPPSSLTLHRATRVRKSKSRKENVGATNG